MNCGSRRVTVRSILKGLAMYVVFHLSLNGAFAWDPYRDITGRTVKQDVEHRIKKAGVAAHKFLNNPIKYLANLPASLVADLCSAPIQYYEGALRAQAGNGWKALPPILVTALQPYYSSNLEVVRYAEGIATADGSAQTFGRYIYFPTSVGLKDRSDLWRMLHELEHTTQFANATNGQAGKLCEYAAKAVGSGLDHDAIDMEQAADRKADYLLDYALYVMYNGLPPGATATNYASRNQLIVYNDTVFNLCFEMETQFTANAQECIAAGNVVIFSSDPRDTWFNVAINTITYDGRDVWVQYGLNGGTRQHILFNQDGALDFFYE